MSMEINRPSVASFVSSVIERSGKTHRQIAEESGLDRPNIISMFKHGTCKVPINRIPALSRSLGVNPSDFLAIVMEEYHPEIWSVIKTTLVQPESAERDRCDLATPL